jgi:hypothetical protein
MQRHNSTAITSEDQLWRKLEKLFDEFCKSRAKDLTVGGAGWHHQRSLLMPDASQAAATGSPNASAITPSHRTPANRLMMTLPHCN